MQKIKITFTDGTSIIGTMHDEGLTGGGYTSLFTFDVRSVSSPRASIAERIQHDEETLSLFFKKWVKQVESV